MIFTYFPVQEQSLRSFEQVRPCPPSILCGIAIRRFFPSGRSGFPISRTRSGSLSFAFGWGAFGFRFGNGRAHRTSGYQHFHPLAHRHIKGIDVASGQKQKKTTRGIGCGGNEYVGQLFSCRLFDLGRCFGGYESQHVTTGSRVLD